MSEMRLIDANELLKKVDAIPPRNGDLEEYCDMDTAWLVGVNDVMSYIETAPTVDTEPVRHGKWILKGVREPLPRDYPPCYGEDEYDEETHSIIVKRYFCSECDYDTMDSLKPKDNYCPNCGAKMDEVTE